MLGETVDDGHGEVGAQQHLSARRCVFILLFVWRFVLCGCVAATRCAHACVCAATDPQQREKRRDDRRVHVWLSLSLTTRRRRAAAAASGGAPGGACSRAPARQRRAAGLPGARRPLRPTARSARASRSTSGRCRRPPPPPCSSSSSTSSPHSLDSSVSSSSSSIASSSSSSSSIASTRASSPATRRRLRASASSAPRSSWWSIAKPARLSCARQRVRSSRRLASSSSARTARGTPCVSTQDTARATCCFRTGTPASSSSVTSLLNMSFFQAPLLSPKSARTKSAALNEAKRQTAWRVRAEERRSMSSGTGQQYACLRVHSEHMSISGVRPSLSYTSSEAPASSSITRRLSESAHLNTGVRPRPSRVAADAPQSRRADKAAAVLSHRFDTHACKAVPPVIGFLSSTGAPMSSASHRTAWG